MVQICPHMAFHFMSILLVSKSQFNLFIGLYDSVMILPLNVAQTFCGSFLIDFVIVSKL